MNTFDKIDKVTEEIQMELSRIVWELSSGAYTEEEMKPILEKLTQIKNDMPDAHELV